MNNFGVFKWCILQIFLAICRWRSQRSVKWTFNLRKWLILTNRFYLISWISRWTLVWISNLGRREIFWWFKLVLLKFFNFFKRNFLKIKITKAIIVLNCLVENTLGHCLLLCFIFFFFDAFNAFKWFYDFMLFWFYSWTLLWQLLTNYWWFLYYPSYFNFRIISST